MRKDYDSAEEAYWEAVRAGRQNAVAHNLGLLLDTVRKDYAGAEQAYRKARVPTRRTQRCTTIWASCWRRGGTKLELSKRAGRP